MRRTASRSPGAFPRLDTYSSIGGMLASRSSIPRPPQKKYANHAGASMGRGCELALRHPDRQRMRHLIAGPISWGPFMQGQLPSRLPLYVQCLLYQFHFEASSPGDRDIIHHPGPDCKFFVRKIFPPPTGCAPRRTPPARGGPGPGSACAGASKGSPGLRRGPCGARPPPPPGGGRCLARAESAADPDAHGGSFPRRGGAPVNRPSVPRPSPAASGAGRPTG